GVFRLHLANVERRKVRRVNDRVAERVAFAGGGTAVSEDKRRGRFGAVVGRLKFRMNECSGYGADPGFVAEQRRMLAEEDGVREPVAHVFDPYLRVAIEGTVGDARSVAVKAAGGARHITPARFL